MARKPMLTKLEFAKQMSTYANISVTQAMACIEFYSTVIEECMKNDLEFQIYNIGKLFPKTIEQEEEHERWNSFSQRSYTRPQHGDYTRVNFRGGISFNQRIREATEKPFDPTRPPKPKKEYPNTQQNTEVETEEEED